MPVISSPKNPAIKHVRSLALKKYREELGLFVAEGEHVLRRARDLGWAPQTLISTTPQPAWGAAEQLVVTPEVMGSLSAQNNPSPVMGVFKQSWGADVKPMGIWLALEDIRDPGNLGSIIRTADAAGARGIVLAGPTCDPWGSECVRATMGSIFAVPLLRREATSLLELMRNWPGDVVGTHLQATEEFRRPYAGTSLIVMGGEGRGLSEPVAKACKALVRIPMRTGVESLNVAVATGLMLFEANRSQK